MRACNGKVERESSGEKICEADGEASEEVFICTWFAFERREVDAQSVP